VASGLPPSAEEALAATTPGRQDVATSPAPARPGDGRTAFTWRLTADQALMMDEMALRLKRQLGRAKLDKAEMLAALVDPPEPFSRGRGESMWRWECVPLAAVCNQSNKGASPLRLTGRSSY
jgi:hypothetical protein